jgi:general secretion pathway protein A
VPEAPAGAAPVAAATPEPAPPPPAPRTLADVLHDANASTDTDAAFAQLFALWNGQYQAGGEDACTQALRQGLECLVSKGSLEDLQRFDRPALLDLQLPDGTMHRVVLASLGNDGADHLLGEQRERVDTAQLVAAWGGDFILLWRPPELDTRSLSLGMRGSTVRALRDRLSQLVGRPIGMRNDNYDADLEREVREFQQHRGLDVDGIAGVRTQVALDAALRTPGTPLLQSSGGS